MKNTERGLETRQDVLLNFHNTRSPVALDGVFFFFFINTVLIITF